MRPGCRIDRVLESAPDCDHYFGRRSGDLIFSYLLWPQSYFSYLPSPSIPSVSFNYSFLPSPSVPFNYSFLPSPSIPSVPFNYSFLPAHPYHRPIKLLISSKPIHPIRPFLTILSIPPHLIYPISSFLSINPIRFFPVHSTNPVPSVQGIGIKGKEMALVCHEKASRTALQTSAINFTHTLLVQTHNLPTFKEIAEQSRQL